MVRPSIRRLSTPAVIRPTARRLNPFVSPQQEQGDIGQLRRQFLPQAISKIVQSVQDIVSSKIEKRREKSQRVVDKVFVTDVAQEKATQIAEALEQEELDQEQFASRLFSKLKENGITVSHPLDRANALDILGDELARDRADSLRSRSEQPTLLDKDAEIGDPVAALAEITDEEREQLLQNPIIANNPIARASALAHFDAAAQQVEVDLQRKQDSEARQTMTEGAIRAIRRGDATQDRFGLSHLGRDISPEEREKAIEDVLQESKDRADQLGVRTSEVLIPAIQAQVNADLALGNPQKASRTFNAFLERRLPDGGPKVVDLGGQSGENLRQLQGRIERAVDEDRRERIENQGFHRDTLQGFISSRLTPVARVASRNNQRIRPAMEQEIKNILSSPEEIPPSVKAALANLRPFEITNITDSLLRTIPDNVRESTVSDQNAAIERARQALDAEDVVQARQVANEPGLLPETRSNILDLIDNEDVFQRAKASNTVVKELNDIISSSREALGDLGNPEIQSEISRFERKFQDAISLVRFESDPFADKAGASQALSEKLSPLISEAQDLRRKAFENRRTTEQADDEALRVLATGTLQEKRELLAREDLSTGMLVKVRQAVDTQERRIENDRLMARNLVRQKLASFESILGVDDLPAQPDIVAQLEQQAVTFFDQLVEESPETASPSLAVTRLQEEVSGQTVQELFSEGKITPEGRRQEAANNIVESFERSQLQDVPRAFRDYLNTLPDIEPTSNVVLREVTDTLTELSEGSVSVDDAADIGRRAASISHLGDNFRKAAGASMALSGSLTLEEIAKGSFSKFEIVPRQLPFFGEEEAIDLVPREMRDTVPGLVGKDPKKLDDVEVVNAVPGKGIAGGALVMSGSLSDIDGVGDLFVLSLDDLGRFPRRFTEESVEEFIGDVPEFVTEVPPGFPEPPEPPEVVSASQRRSNIINFFGLDEDATNADIATELNEARARLGQLRSLTE